MLSPEALWQLNQNCVLAPAGLDLLLGNAEISYPEFYQRLLSTRNHTPFRFSTMNYICVSTFIFLIDLRTVDATRVVSDGEDMPRFHGLLPIQTHFLTFAGTKPTSARCETLLENFETTSRTVKLDTIRLVKVPTKEEDDPKLFRHVFSMSHVLNWNKYEVDVPECLFIHLFIHSLFRSWESKFNNNRVSAVAARRHVGGWLVGRSVGARLWMTSRSNNRVGAANAG